MGGSRGGEAPPRYHRVIGSSGLVVFRPGQKQVRNNQVASLFGMANKVLTTLCILVCPKFIDRILLYNLLYLESWFTIVRDISSNIYTDENYILNISLSS